MSHWVHRLLPAAVSGSIDTAYRVKPRKEALTQAVPDPNYSVGFFFTPIRRE